MTNLTCLPGHRHLWLDGVLHRDISVGNVLIVPVESKPGKTRGCLTDFDHAKQTSERLTLPDINDIVDPTDVESVREGIKAFGKVTLSDEGAAAVFRHVGTDDADAYVKSARTIWSEKRENVRIRMLLVLSPHILTCLL